MKSSKKSRFKPPVGAKPKLLVLGTPSPLYSDIKFRHFLHSLHEDASPHLVESTLEFRRAWVWPGSYKHVLPIPPSLRERV